MYKYNIIYNIYKYTAWWADYWQGECPAQGWWWRESKKSNNNSKPLGIYKNGAKTAGFPLLLT
jgi:hypothetical protein